MTNPCEESRKGLTNGLREFITIDNHRNFGVRHLKEGSGTFKIRRWRGQEEGPEVAVREITDELPLEAEEVGTWKTYTNVDHIAKERWGPLLVDADWHAFCQALCKGIEGEDWGELYDACKEMSRVMGVKKPQEAQKAKALWKNEGSQGCRRRVLRSNVCRQHPGDKQDKIITLGRAPQRSMCGIGHTPEVCGEFAHEVLARVLCGGSVLQWLALAYSKFCGKNRTGRAFGPTWIQWIVCGYAHRPWSGVCQESTGRTASSFSS